MPRRRKAYRDPLPQLAPGCEVWAYLRVSSEQQADKGLPIEGQRSAIEQYCSGRGYRLTRTYTDEAISGSTDERPEFVAMVEDAERRRPAALVMWKWDRFSRDSDDAPYYRGRLRRCGIELLTLADNIPEQAGEMRPVLEAMVDLFNQRYLAELSRNVRRGQRTLAEMGYVPCVWHDGNRPVGYRMAERTVRIGSKDHVVHVIELDPETAPVARRAWEMRLAGATYEQIHAALRIRTRATNLRLMFRNPLYAGRYHWGEVEIAVPAIVTQEEWQQVQEGLGSVGGGAPRRKGSRYLLSGLVFCPRCGAALTGATYRPANGRTYRYYQCRHSDRRSCGEPAVDADAVERVVVETLLAEVLTAEWLERHEGELGEQRRSERELRAAKRSALEREREEVQAALGNLVRAIESGADASSVAVRLRERERELVRIERDLAILEREGEAAEERTRPDVGAMREQLAAAMETGEVRLARELLKSLIERVEIGADGVAEIRFRGVFGIR
jgi:site-specific DNA recombinase